MDFKDSKAELSKPLDESGFMVNLEHNNLNDLALPPESYYLVFLFQSKDFSKDKSIPLQTDEEIINNMINSEIINIKETNEKVFLTYRGISLANTIIQIITKNKVNKKDVNNLKI